MLKKKKFETRAVHVGNQADPETGSITPSIHLTYGEVIEWDCIAVRRAKLSGESCLIKLEIIYSLTGLELTFIFLTLSLNF